MGVLLLGLDAQGGVSQVSCLQGGNGRPMGVCTFRVRLMAEIVRRGTGPAGRGLPVSHPAGLGLGTKKKLEEEVWGQALGLGRRSGVGGGSASG